MEIVAPGSLFTSVQKAQAHISAAVLASGTLHLLLALSPEEGASTCSVNVENHMDFDVVAIPLAPAAEGSSAVPTQAEEPRPPPPSRRQRTAPPARLPARWRSEPSAEHVTARARHEIEVRGSTRESSAKASSEPDLAGASGQDLSPSAAARTLATSLEATWSLPHADKENSDVDRAAEARLAEAVPELSRKGEDGINQGAEQMTWLFARPWEFILEPLRGARYYFRGLGFDAIIRGDGSIQYRYKSGLHTAFGRATALDNGAPGPTGRPVTSFGLGFNDALMPKLYGYDPHRSERRRFLERTRALRELLHERAWRVALARAAVHLGRRLAMIQLELAGGHERAARAQLFALWDECAEDEVGAIARKRIEAFAREQCAQESNLAFDPSELSRLNQKRLSHQRFLPYASAPDAGTESEAKSLSLP